MPAPPGKPFSPASVLVFDVNETLSDMTAMQARFADVGVPGLLAHSWFAAVLRDGFARTAVGAPVPFAVVAEEQLRVLLTAHRPGRDPDEAVRHVMEGFSGLPLHPDVVPGVQALAAAGFRLVTLSNGAATVAEGLLSRAGIRDRFEHVLSVEDAGAWKPARAAYEHALEVCGVAAQDAVLVAVHPWDLDGAARAGLRTAWVDRSSAHYPSYCPAPTWQVVSLTQLAGTVGGGQ